MLITIILGAAFFPLEASRTTAYAETPMATMTEDQLKSRVAERYKAVFGALFMQNPIDHSYIRMPEIPAEDFAIRGETEEVWTVVHDPLVGVMVRATVSKANGLVQFDAIDLAVE
jgi:hypothetical protein